MTSIWLHKMDVEGKTPLGRAFDSGHRAIAEMLIRQEEAEKTGGDDGPDALHRAAGLGLTDAVKSLIEFGFKITEDEIHRETPLHKAVKKGHVETAEALLVISDVNAPSDVGMTPLHWASITGDAEAAQLLLRHGADPYIRDESMDGLNAVEIASLMGYAELSAVYDARANFV